MIKKTSERLQRGCSLIQKESPHKYERRLSSGRLSEMYKSQSSCLHSSHQCCFLIAINNPVARAKGDLCIQWVMTGCENWELQALNMKCRVLSLHAVF